MFLSHFAKNHPLDIINLPNIANNVFDIFTKKETKPQELKTNNYLEQRSKLVIIESPYKGNNYEQLQGNIAYARSCLRDSLKRGESPFASHLLYTQDGVLDDTDTEERKLGIEAGLLWGLAACKTVVYTDLGISAGMEQGIAAAMRDNRPVEYRTLNFYPFPVNKKAK